MSRFTGPRLKVMRALGIDLPGLSRKTIEQRPNPPGQHGARMRRKSGFGSQLMEKQKLRMNYGLTETQIRRLMAEAKRDRGATGDKLAQLIERRLDNVVFRAGFAPTIPAARQLVNHGHFLVNGKTVDIASYRVRIGDVITVRDKSKGLGLIKESLADLPLTRPEWLHWDESGMSARISHLPGVTDIPFPIEMQLVVEYYATRM